jgi:hypothetical protein
MGRTATILGTVRSRKTKTAVFAFARRRDMQAKILLIGAATALMAAGASQAATSRAGAYTQPAQPVPYSQLGAYMKASPHARASKDWSAGASSASAATGTAADTSATTQAMPAAPAPAAQGPVNPAPSQAAPADSTMSQPMNAPAPADSSAPQPSASDSGSTAGPSATGGGATP